MRADLSSVATKYGESALQIEEVGLKTVRPCRYSSHVVEAR